MLKCVAVCCRRYAKQANVRRDFGMCGNDHLCIHCVLHYVAVCCSVLQCVAVDGLGRGVKGVCKYVVFIGQGVLYNSKFVTV